uniref:Tim10-like domain-containing protein n=1 Tax=Calidris pygmaea TaxID=425635 RepID=A0A8C3J5V0_9CHAR
MAGQISESEQIKQFKEFLGTYNKLTENCFLDCIKDFTSREVKPEEVRKCLNKPFVELLRSIQFLEATLKVLVFELAKKTRKQSLVEYRCLVDSFQVRKCVSGRKSLSVVMLLQVCPKVMTNTSLRPSSLFTKRNQTKPSAVDVLDIACRQTVG